MHDAPASESSPVVLITGTSSGFGRITAEHLAAAGMRVFGTSRTVAAEPPPFTPIAMDVDDDGSVADGVAAVLAAAGRIDVVVNNAGISVAGAIEDTSLAEARRQLETNFFGPVRVVQAVLPHMRARRSGTIINIGSIAGLVALPFQGFYSASKFGVEALTEALRLELRPWGIHVCCVEPGDFRTALTTKRVFATRARSDTYGAQMRATLDIYEHDERSGADPILVARLIERLIHTRDPKARYLVGGAGQKAGALLKRVLGARVFERILARHCGIGT
jgi:NAD(P)-dependent dehydrogenase (short-subunit alcohol dehydrogenase family)